MNLFYYTTKPIIFPTLSVQRTRLVEFIKHTVPSAENDASLVERYRNSGDLRLLAALYQPYMDLVYGVCFKYLRDSDASKDAVMDIFEQLTDKLLRHEVNQFRSWLFTVARNHCLMILRSGSRGKSVSIDDSRMQLPEEMHHEEIAESDWKFDQLAQCMETLAAEQKRTIELFYLQEKCYKDIAVLTGMEWNRVRSLIQNGRRNLKLCMEEAQNTPGGRIINSYQK